MSEEMNEKSLSRNIKVKLSTWYTIWSI